MLLQAKNVSLAYGSVEIVKDVNIEINKGDIVTLIGPNGSGKSTILKSLCRYLKPKVGEVIIEGVNINKINTKKVAKKIAILPQTRNIINDYSIETLVGFGRFPHIGFGKKLKAKDYEVINWALAKTGLTHMKNRSVKTLSGGERQRAFIAMALAQKTEILILDEPTTFLDISYQLEVLELVKEINETLGLTIIMVLHDLNLAARYSHKIYAIKDGKVFKHGITRDLISKDTLKEVFKVEAEIYEDHHNDCPYFIPQRVFNE